MAPSVGVLSRGDPESPVPTRENSRLHRVFEELSARGVEAEPVIFYEEELEAVRTQLLSMDAVLVWVDPIVAGRDRTVLDTLLREVAAQGVFVSAHPDVILKMGTKDVLVRTRDMEWGTDTFLYQSVEELRESLPELLQAGLRVLKQLRGNGGNGVWKVQLIEKSGQPLKSAVEVQHALRGSRLETMTLDEFVERCKPYFAASGCMIDQPYQPRLGEGMTRCYMVQDRVVGFGHQFVTALLEPPEGTIESPAPTPRLYYGPDKAEFQNLKDKLESQWIREMQELLDIETHSLPMIWDADFLLGPKTAAGEDTYVLCEINVSSVFPIPDEAFGPLADATITRISAARQDAG